MKQPDTAEVFAELLLWAQKARALKRPPKVIEATFRSLVEADFYGMKIPLSRVKSWERRGWLVELAHEGRKKRWRISK